MKMEMIPSAEILFNVGLQDANYQKMAGSNLKAYLVLFTFCYFVFEHPGTLVFFPLYKHTRSMLNATLISIFHIYCHVLRLGTSTHIWK
jgi:hypothetical protein